MWSVPGRVRHGVWEGHGRGSMVSGEAMVGGGHGRGRPGVWGGHGRGNMVSGEAMVGEHGVWGGQGQGRAWCLGRFSDGNLWKCLVIFW